MFWLYLAFASVDCSEIAPVPNLTLVINSKFRSIHCVLSDDTLNTAIAWKLPVAQPVRVSDYLSFGGFRDNNCDMNAEDACLKDWTSPGQWQPWNSLIVGQTSWDGVLDHRWEKLPTISVSDKYVLNTTDFPRTFRLSFSVQTASVATLEACAKNVGCASYAILPEDKISDVPYNGSDWSHYTLVGQRHLLMILRGKFTHFIFDNSSVAELDLTLSSLTIFGSKQSVGLWKFHQYSFIFTTNGTEAQLGPPFHLFRSDAFCMAFFVTMCDLCGMELKLVDLKDNVVESMIFEGKGGWKQTRFFVTNERLAQLRDQSNSDTTYKVLFHGITYSSLPHWAIDDVRQCEVQDVRSSTVTFIEKDLHLYSCYALRYPTFQIHASAGRIVHSSDSRCSITTFGMSCMQCYLIAGKPYCDGYRVCELDAHHNTKCTCSAGFRGPTCEQACDASYGFGCRENCGECLNTCHPISGVCDDCTDGYSGDICKTPRLPILKHPPRTKVSHTYITLQLESEEYEGSVAPSKYIFQYKRGNEIWQNSSEYDFRDLSPKDFVGLLPDTEYTVRGLLRTQNDTFEEQYVRVKHVRTTCAGIGEQDVTLRPQTNRVAIIIMNSTETCQASNFLLDFNYQTIPFNQYTLELAPLVAHTEYTFGIISLKTDNTFLIHFTTKQAAPKEVEDFKECPITPTSVKLSWEPPRITNGVIRYYKVSFKHERYLRCYYTVRSKASSGKIRTENTTVIIDDLIPFSEYVASVRAVTTSEGGVKHIKFKTLPTVLPNYDELPLLDLIQRSKSVDVYLTEANCDKRFGPLLYTLRLCCSEEWCTCETTNITSTTREVTYAYFNIHAFSSYLLRVDMQRPNGIRTEQTLGQTFTTTKSAPNNVRNLTVFYKTTEQVALRCLPPHPPSGKIKHYIISYKCKTFQSDSMKIKPKMCEQWPKFLCFKLPVKEMCLNSSLSIEVKAQNEEVPNEYGPPTIITTTFGIEKPHPPRNFSAAWDDHHNLTLTWTYSDVNGPLKGFKIRVFGEPERDFKTNEEKQLYTFTITDAKPSSELFITLVAENSVGESRMVNLVTFSPPNTPEFTADPYLIEIGNLTRLITIPELSQLSIDSTLYVTVHDANKVDNSTIQKFLAEIQKITINNEQTSMWIAMEFVFGINSEKERQFTLGSGEVKYSTRLMQTVTNRKLKPEMNYTVSFLLSNKYHGKTRSNVRAISFSTRRHNNDGPS